MKVKLLKAQIERGMETTIVAFVPEYEADLVSAAFGSERVSFEETQSFYNAQSVADERERLSNKYRRYFHQVYPTDEALKKACENACADDKKKPPTKKAES